MNRLFKWAFCVCAFGMFLGCNNEIENPEIDNEELEIPSEVSFIYKGVKYESECITIDDEAFIVDDEVRKIAELLREKTNLCTIVTPDGTIVYFDSYEEGKEALGINEEKESIEETRSFLKTVQADLWLHENTNNKKMFHHDIIVGEKILRYSSIPKGKDRKISACNLVVTSKVENYSPTLSDIRTAFVVFFDELDFNGLTLVFYAGADEPQNEVPNFKKYPHYPGSSKNWNDRPRSYKTGVVKKFDLPNLGTPNMYPWKNF